MIARLFVATLLVAVSSGCGPTDTTITKGVDSDQQWTRRLALAVPIGTPADSAHTIMARNGFTCREGTDSVSYLWCDKQSSQDISVVRRWQAVLNLDGGRRVYEVRGFTGLIGP